MEGLQTLPFGSKSQVIGAKEQGPKRECGCPHAYMRVASPAAMGGYVCQSMIDSSSKCIGF